MADTLALGASAVRHGGSSPLSPTKSRLRKRSLILCEKKSNVIAFREDLKTFDSFL
jgi:hypothetical protein